MKKLLALSTLLLPALSFAQQTPDTPSIVQNDGLFSALTFISQTINFAIPVLIAIAVIVVIFNVIKFIVQAGDPEKRKEGAKGIIVGLIGLTVIISIWGLVNVLVNTFNLDQTTGPTTFPTVPGPRGVR